MNTSRDTAPELRALSHLKGLRETTLHTDIILPLLQKIGTNVEYVHGSGEEGKDFVYITRDVYGEPVLEVCQVKNSPFSGQAASPMNATALLSQLLECKTLEVMHPITHKKDLPASVTLISTYDLPQRLIRNSQRLLDELRENRCRFIGPDKLIGLLQRHLPQLYDSLAHVAKGLEKALLVYVDTHHEGMALGVRHPRALHTFFVDLGLLSQLSTRPSALARAGDGGIPSRAYSEVLANQRLLPDDLATSPLLNVGRTKKGTDGQAVREIKGCSISDVNTTVSEKINAPNRDAAKALDTLATWTTFINGTLPLLPSEMMRRELEAINRTGLQLQDLPPQAILAFGEAFSLDGEAGAGKTSLGRALTRCGLDMGKKCVFFPCYAHRVPGQSLADSIVAFLCALSSETNHESATRYIRNADLIVIDGCDEAYNFGKGFEDDLRTLHGWMIEHRDIHVVLDEPASRLIVPSECQCSLRSTPIHKTEDGRPRSKLSCVLPLRRTDFARLIAMNKHLASAIKHLQVLYAQQRCQMLVTSRDVTSLDLPATYHRFSLTPFTDHQLQLFFQKWFDANSDEYREVLFFLDSTPHLKEVCRRPLVASLLASMRQSGCELPRTKTELYTQRFELLLQDWDTAKKVPRRNQVRKLDKLAFLTRLAFTLHIEHRRQFTLPDVARAWDDTISALYPGVTPDILTAELHLANGVIVRSSASEYTLGHLSYQEYLVARAVLHLQKESVLFARWQRRWWREVLVFYAGLKGDIADALLVLQEEHGLDRNAGLLEELLAEARYTNPVVSDVVRDMGEEEDFIRDSQGREPFEDVAGLDGYRELENVGPDATERFAKELGRAEARFGKRRR